MKKPEVGSRVIAYRSVNGVPSLSGRVIAVFDSFTENWDPWGEHAAAQIDMDEVNERQGDWYVIVQAEDDEGETWSLGSYEVRRVER